MRLISRLAVFSGLVLALTAPAAAGAQVVGFDNLTCGTGAGFSPYMGYNWNGFLCYDATIGNNSPGNSANAVVSKNNVIYNRMGTGSNITSANPFSFTSAWITRAVSNYNETYRISGYLGANLIGYVDVIEPQIATLFTFNFTGIDKVLFTNISNPNANAGLFLDDITFTPVASGPVVPEPATILLTGTGLAALGLVTRRRRAV